MKITRITKSALFLAAFTFLCIGYAGCKKDPCKHKECANGGVCVEGTCICQPGFEGEHCLDVVDPCENIICLNGGDCINGLCDCATGYIGPNCGTAQVLNKVRIISITVTDFPSTSSNGAGWDLTSGPDIYPKILYNGVEIYDHPSFHQNANPDNNYTFEINFTLNNMSGEYSIILYDYDDFDPDDWMGGYIFTPSEASAGFPPVWNMIQGDVDFGVQVEYIF